MSNITFTVPVNFNTNWRVRVIVWPDDAALFEAYKATPPNDDTPPHCDAFCHQLEMEELVKAEDRVLAVIHFSRESGVSPGLIAHESWHAFLNYARLIQLRLHECDTSGEEWAAESLQSIIGGIMEQLKLNGVDVNVLAK